MRQPRPMSNACRVYSLIARAEDAHDPNDAMKFSQAALNAAHALMVTAGLRRDGRPEDEPRPADREAPLPRGGV